MSKENLLEVNRLITSFETERGMLRAVDQVSFSIPYGKTVGIVGESGCGKSVTAMSIMRLLPQPSGKILGGEIHFKGEDLLHASDKRMREVRGSNRTAALDRVAVLTALNLAAELLQGKQQGGAQDQRGGDDREGVVLAEAAR